MLDPVETLRLYLRAVQRLRAALAASLYVPSPAGSAAGALLLHEGEGEPLPELADLPAAEAFAREAPPSAAADLRAGRPQEMPSAAGGVLIPLPMPWGVHQLLPPGLALGEERGAERRRAGTHDPEAEVAAWLGLRQAGAPPPGARIELADHLLALSATLAWCAQRTRVLLADPLTGLPGRAGFEIALREAFESARERRKPLALVLVNPEGFVEVNAQFGRPAGDAILRGLVERLRSSFRRSDVLLRYGGAVFAALLTDTPAPAARRLAEEVAARCTEAAFLEGAVRLGLSIGIAVAEPHGEPLREPFELMRRADQALCAVKRRSPGGVAVWQERFEAEQIGNVDRLSGIFTGDLAKDYRNMVLLWDAVELMASGMDPDALAARAVAKLAGALGAERAALFSAEKGGALRLTHAHVRGPAGEDGEAQASHLELSAAQRALVERAVRERSAVETAHGGTSSCALPLLAGDECLGCLYLDARREELLDSSDLSFLRALAAQLALALDRGRLRELERSRQELERRRLREELSELRQMLRPGQLEYVSPQMEELLALAQRVARTDATVLITGESGVGKEVLAQVIHELSGRREARLIVVDCDAIPPTLIESELFGHERGGFTGAHQRAGGRLAEADGGTVLLDEIGDLPLEIQGRLLRFVQEKQLTPVGGTRPRSVDVRVIAATNRDLASEVAAGRFRADLYYRLNVVHLEVPPLRERPADILHLARHFLRGYASLHGKELARLSREAEAALVRYPWPGNVRELQNRILRAVILGDGEELEAAALALPAAADGPSPGAAASPPRPGAAALWERLRDALARQIAAATAQGERRTPPLGRWLREDLLLAAHEAAQGVGRRAAAILGLSESTARRRLQQATDQQHAGLAPRPTGWEEVREILAGLVRAPDLDRADLVERSQRILLEEALRLRPDDARTGARLLGVTLPTFRRFAARRIAP